MGTFNTFDEGSTFARFREEGHNLRTRNAWENGVRIAATGGPLVYQDSKSDYASAELAGVSEGERLMESGLLYHCPNCGHEPAPPWSEETTA